MIVYTYNYWLVALSVVISMMSAFTGLTLTSGLSVQTSGQKQVRIIMAAIALGGGIWSMHFVAMLAMRFGIPVFYLVIETVASAFIAVLLAGLALLILHFGRRTQASIVTSGTILGLGIVAMHYVGLSAIEGCLPVYSPYAPVLAGALAICMGVVAMEMAYGRRTGRNLLFATLMFGASVAVVHFSAMQWTTFLPDAPVVALVPVMANAQVAIFVLLSVFVISGAFLVSGASFVAGAAAPTAPGAVNPAVQPVRIPAPEAPDAELVVAEIPAATPLPPTVKLRLPYEKDGKTYFVPFERVIALRAEGHYTTAYFDQSAVFCPWSITRAETAVPASFLRVHRGWLVNLAMVQGVERSKDNGFCLFADGSPVDRVPVSRSRITLLRAALGL